MDDIKMTDKQTILIAGATGNIGGGAAVALAKRGARVVVLGRVLERLADRANSIRVTLSEAQIDYQDTDIATLVIDFSDMESVRLAAREAMNRFPMINWLILSSVALVQKGPNILPSGHELMFATHRGSFLFIQRLLEWMEQSDGLVLHVINMSNKEIDWDDLESIRNHKTNIHFRFT
jgi:NAD(P)-dependent dehydrogenase (short-subunit alcohol dehydrogenase family)